MAEKKSYERPAMIVVPLNLKTQLLQSSINSGSVNATMNNEWDETDW